jgi:hypothetical protein
MCQTGIKYRIILSPLFSLVFLLFYINAFSQNLTNNDSIFRIRSGPFFEPSESGSIFLNIPFIDPAHLIQSSNITPDKNLFFYNSLEVRASKRPLTKKLFDFLIVNPDTINSKQITATSDASYFKYSGNIIRNIAIERLNVFGVNINEPAASNPKKIDNVLNKTHINTSESIIRKNLLFSEGDTISPLTLSDNERILRQLPFINDARIIVVPASETESDILILTKDIYSLGGSYTYKGLKEGSVSIFEKNLFGMGHEFGVEVPYDSKKPNSPGFGFHYLVDNIAKSFVNLNVFYLNALGERTYGLSLDRKLVSSATKYAGGISVRQMYTTIALNIPTTKYPLKYNFQDYWLARSFLINKESVSRIIIGARYTNNNVFERPSILPNSYYSLQRYRIFLGSAAFSIQKYYKTNLIYSYGRTEDIPHGGLIKITAGKENNEFKNRSYLGAEISFGESSKKLGYFYLSTGYAAFLNQNQTEQGILSLNMKYFSNLVILGKYKIRNFVYADYTRGFDRNSDERLYYYTENGFSGFKNDSVWGNQRVTLSLETVIFSPVNLYGFKFAFFGFTDFSSLAGTNQIFANGINLTGLGLGMRIRNDNLVFNTFQFRLGFFPNPPQYSRINYFQVSGEQLLTPYKFDPGPPSIIPYR